MFGGRGTGRKRRLSRQRVSPGEKLPSGWLLLPDAQDNAEKQYINTVNHTLARRGLYQGRCDMAYNCSH